MSWSLRSIQLYTPVGTLRPVSDPAPATDTAGRGASATRSLSDPAPAVDAVTVLGLRCTDNAAATDTAGRVTPSRVRSIADTAPATDTVNSGNRPPPGSLMPQRLTIGAVPVALNARGYSGVRLIVTNTDGSHAADLGPGDVIGGGGFPLAAGSRIVVDLKAGDVLSAVRSASTDVVVAVLRS